MNFRCPRCGAESEDREAILKHFYANSCSILYCEVCEEPRFHPAVETTELLRTQLADLNAREVEHGNQLAAAYHTGLADGGRQAREAHRCPTLTRWGHLKAAVTGAP